MTVEVCEEPVERLEEQAELSIAFTVDRMLVATPLDGGLGGITLEEQPVAPSWVKDYDVLDGEGPARWRRSFDVTRWGFLVARDGDERVGGAVIAFDTPNVHLLDGRRDLATLWDLRVHPDRRSSAHSGRCTNSAIRSSPTRCSSSGTSRSRGSPPPWRRGPTRRRCPPLPGRRAR